jgi:hypothetical protein
MESKNKYENKEMKLKLKKVRARMLEILKEIESSPNSKELWIEYKKLQKLETMRKMS